ncbi:glycosyltransferase involved in cell wall biosynthesis [Solirubrobacter pauli]|uniref:Glycosyltransferase involved in cell wall biosynthesis n=1 Tax=Solirubrobacter pauli TaxID=166793 RepID=A0A660L6J8_9ACTN|nr:glycosyltransferase [Solirubrobacter pauli]RKQ87190.1 glycosyltransferase involved in cell wall biosynthesis [Solirubrobacter pauli]
MPPALPHRALYAAFDRFPSRKGSAVHIDRFARALFERSGGGLLYVLGGEDLPAYQHEGDVEVVRYMRPAAHVLERAAGFGTRLSALLDELPELEVAHFRDPWSGLPIVDHPGDFLRVYEVNGLPSIELAFLYPAIPRGLLDRIAEVELRCLQAADLVITPSQVTADRLPVDAVVVPNGADVRPPAPRPALDRPYLLYFGALQPWQGVDTALRAVARLELDLVICASVHARRAKPYRKLAEKLGIEDRVHWHFALPEEELARWRDHALLSLAPLRDCSRNAHQGCAPLKILESMAAGVPVVASDMPAVRELVTDGVHGRLVAPDRPGELARAIRVLLDYPEERARMGAAARARVQAELTWEASVTRLQSLYGERMPAWPTA